jgi:hypothetical protein
MPDKKAFMDDPSGEDDGIIFRTRFTYLRLPWAPVLQVHNYLQAITTVAAFLGWIFLFHL